MLKIIFATSLLFSLSSAFAAECILTLSLDGRPLLQNRILIDGTQKVLKVIDEEKNEIIRFTKNKKGAYDLTFGFPFSNVLVSGEASIKSTNNKQFSVIGSVTDDLNNKARINGIIAGCE